jgi:competence ComEA-like helix-hairpin-helix protein
MSDAFKDFVARREASIKAKESSGNLIWVLLGLVAVGAIVYIVLRGDPSTGPVNPNTATVEQLQNLPGVGPETAEKIIAKRSEKPFAKAEDLLEVPNIGPKTLEKMKPQLKFE